MTKNNLFIINSAIAKLNVYEPKMNDVDYQFILLFLEDYKNNLSKYSANFLVTFSYETVEQILAIKEFTEKAFPHGYIHKVV